jgi:integrase
MKKKSIWLFPGTDGHLTESGLYTSFNKKYSITSFHAFRRTLITNYIKNGADLLISEMLMNHAPSSVEGEHYVKLSMKEKRVFFEKLFPYTDFFCF